MSPSNDLFLQVFLFQNKSHKYYDENITFSHKTISQYCIVLTICILNVFNRCPDLPVSYSPVYFSKSLQCFHERIHNNSADIWYTTDNLQIQLSHGWAKSFLRRNFLTRVYLYLVDIDSRFHGKNTNMFVYFDST